MLYHYTLPALALMTAPLAAQELVVVTDIAPVHSLTAQVMEGVGTPTLLVGPGSSPHNFSLRPSQAQALQDANAVFWVGPDLTPWLEGPLEELARIEHSVALMEAPGVLELPTREGPIFGSAEHDDHGHDDHAEHKHDDHGHDDHAEHKHDDHGHEGHAHGAFDPHGWLSPDNAKIWLTVIAEHLSDAAPEHADTFRANAAKAQAALDNTVAEVTATLAPVKEQGFIVYHDAFQYFEAHFGLTSLGSVAFSDAQAPSPRRIADLRAHIQQDQPACAFSEPQLNTRLMDTVLEGEGVKVAVIDPLGSTVEPGPQLYNTLLRNMASSIATCAD